jgi:hypothetical protein
MIHIFSAVKILQWKETLNYLLSSVLTEKRVKMRFSLFLKNL